MTIDQQIAALREQKRIEAGGCFCTDKCMAPKIMGVQQPCLRNPPESNLAGTSTEEGE